MKTALAALLALLVLAPAAQAAPPQCLSGTASGVEAGKSLTLTPQCSDSDGDPLTYTVLTGPSHGTLTQTSPTQWTYTAGLGYSGPDQITYKATANGEDSNVATHTINIFDAPPQCGAPVLIAQSGQTLQMLPQCRDPEGEPFTVTVTQPPGHGTFDPVNWRYTSVTGYTGQDTFTYQASDGLGTSSPATATIIVQAAGPPPPQVGKSVVLSPVSGTVLVRVPGSTAFRRLAAGENLPVGTRVDVTKGRIRLTSAADATGGTQTADFYGGRFTITQNKSAHPVTELRLDRPSCSGRASAATGKKKKKVNEVWGDGKGAFRTRGRYGSAAIRGTKWLTRDRCDGTFFKVATGVVTVRDLVRRKTVVLRAPKTYLARKRR